MFKRETSNEKGCFKMSSIKKKRILAAVLCAGTLAACYQPAPVAAAGRGLTYLDDVYGTQNVKITDSVTINGVTMERYSYEIHDN